MLKAGALVELTLEKPVAGGRMLARHDGQVVLVAGAIPGERVRARIDRVNKGMAFATTLAAIQPSPARREVVGDPLCGGTVYAHVAYAEQAAIKREVLRDALRHGGRIEWPGDLPVTSSPEHSYRMRARLHVRKGRVGFFREGTHDLCDCAGTGQLLPESIEAVRAFVDATPRAVRDAIDAIELTESIAADERVLHVLWAPHTRINTMPLDGIWRLDRPERNEAQSNPSNLSNLSKLTGITCDDPSTGLARTISGQPWVSDPLDALIRSTASPVGDSHVVDARPRARVCGGMQRPSFRRTAISCPTSSPPCTARSATSESRTPLATITVPLSISTPASACSRSHSPPCVLRARMPRTARASSPSKAIHRARAIWRRTPKRLRAAMTGAATTGAPTMCPALRAEAAPRRGFRSSIRRSNTTSSDSRPRRSRHHPR